MIVGDKYAIKIFDPVKNIYSEVMKEDIKQIKKKIEIRKGMFVDMKSS